jgi:catechol 2,3-dioxygenase-like lactoylglutathione lyase family enzyme
MDKQVVPVLRITDYERSKAFYVDGLGFQIDWEHRFKPDFPVFMQLTRDDMTIDLTQHTGDCQTGGLVLIYVANVDDWYAELQKKGVSVHEPPNESLQGLRDMTVIDPDGNKLRFCTRLKDWRR